MDQRPTVVSNRLIDLLLPIVARVKAKVLANDYLILVRVSRLELENVLVAQALRKSLILPLRKRIDENFFLHFFMGVFFQWSLPSWCALWRLVHALAVRLGSSAELCRGLNLLLLLVARVLLYLKLT